MSGPDFAGVIAAHREDATYPDTCLCESEAFPEGPSGGHYAAHLSAALHVELTRWLADEGTRRRLALVLRQSARAHLGLNEGEFWPSTIADAQATAALAALTTTDQEDHR